MPTSQDRGRRRRLATTTLLAVLTVAALAAGASGAGAATTAGRARSVSVQDPQDVPDPRVDLRAATAAVSSDGRFVTVTARLAEPTSPTSVYWWRGYSLPRPGISWGFNVDPASPSWVYRAELRGDPVLGPYGYVAHEPGESPDQVTCRVTPSFDGASYRMRFPVSCIGSPARVRFGVYVQLYDETGNDILGGDIAPGFDEVSDWLVLR